ncbi:MAG: LptF/LptG family permease [Deltaproteobacteria bacterium]|nr:LptF/LptG family permease [Deltaproteobacteria bacterium]
MDTLDRYLAREFFSYFFLVWAILATLFLSVDFFTRYWDLRMGLGQVFQLYAYQTPSVLQQFLPVAVLMASLLVLASMSRQNEILALYLSGVGLWRLVSTFVAIVATLSTICFLFFDNWVPYFEKKKVLLKQGLDTSDEQVLQFGNERFWYRSGQLFYNVGRYLPDRNILEDLNIYVLDGDFRVRERIQAKLARFLNDEWVLEDGFSVQYPPESHYPVSNAFKSRSGVIPEKPSDFKTLRVEEAMMPLKDLRHYINRNRSYGFDTTLPQVSYQERVALIFAPLIFVMFALALSTQALRHHSTGRMVGLCFLIVSVYLLFFRITISVGRGGHIPPILAGWSANALFLAASLLIMIKKR